MLEWLIGLLAVMAMIAFWGVFLFGSALLALLLLRCLPLRPRNRRSTDHETTDPEIANVPDADR